jgi:hypothetical protein
MHFRSGSFAFWPVRIMFGEEAKPGSRRDATFKLNLVERSVSLA